MYRLSILISLLFVTTTISARERTLEEKLSAARQVLPAATRGSDNSLKVIRADEALTVVGGDSVGFAVIANDDAYNAVVGYSTDAYSDKNLALVWYLSAANNAMRSSGVATRAGVPADCKANVDHLLTSTWDQGEPYWDLCPTDSIGEHCWAGCVATAMAQIMYYYKYPATITDNGKTVTYRGNTYGFHDLWLDNNIYWDQLIDSYSGTYSTRQGSEVANLIYNCGIAAGMDYGIDGSGAYSVNAAEAFHDNFNYNAQYYGTKQNYVGDIYTDVYDDTEWKDVVYREISSSHPVFYAATSYKNGWDKPSVHAFVLDGYDSNGLVGVNWGYSGGGDGYFDLDILPLNYSGTDEEYSYYQEMIVVHKPDDPITYNLQPTATGIYNNKVYTDDAPAEVYSIDGIRLPSTDQKGIVIVRKDGKTTKVVK